MRENDDQIFHVISVFFFSVLLCAAAAKATESCFAAAACFLFSWWDPQPNAGVLFGSGCCWSRGSTHEPQTQVKPRRQTPT